MKTLIICLFFLTLSFGCSDSKNQAAELVSSPKTASPSPDSKKLALKGNRAWLAFEASVFSAEAGEKPEIQEKFINLGIKEGREFLAACEAKQIKEEDFHSVVYWQVSFRLQGPSNDFILGRLYAAAEEKAFEPIMEKLQDGNLPEKELRVLRAKNKLAEMHADVLLGE